MSSRRFYVIVALFVLVIGCAAGVLRQLLIGLPDIRSLEDYTPSLTTRIHDAKGNVIAELSLERRVLIPLSKIPVDLQNAVLAQEDDQFFKHWGISPRGILRSVVTNIRLRRRAGGGSTITQQLARQIFLTRKRVYVRKIREILLAIQIERNFSKPEILQMYLNQIYFGEGAYGVSAAARIYFGKEVADLTLADCALLAGMIRAPVANSPFTFPDRAARRRAIIIDRMLEERMITAQEKEAALAVPVPAVKPESFAAQAPYFVEHVRKRLERKYGYHALWRGGLKVYTTLDLDMQRVAEGVMEKSLAAFDERALVEWEKKQKEAALSPETVDVSTVPPPKIQGSFLLMDVKTGAIKAMIGGRDSIFNRAVQARRQPGSTFKAFVWAAALNGEKTASSLVDDTPLAYYYDGRDWRLLEGATDQYSINLATAPFAQSPDFKIWVPNNFDGKFLGTITLRKALALSRNIASIRLIEQIGPPLVVDLAHKAGIKSDLDPVLSLGLGSSVVSPLEMVSAFGTFANSGIYVTPYTIERVEDNNGRQLESHVPSELEAMSPQVAYLITNLLKGVVNAGTGVHARRLRRPLAGKTGTSNDNRDLWFVGYTPDLSAAAWMGYDDFQSLGRKDWTGGSTVLPWWTEIMGEVLKEYPKRDFSAPSGIVFQRVDADTGMLALPSCPKNRILLEAFLEGSQPKQYCGVDHSQPVEAQLGFGPQAPSVPMAASLVMPSTGASVSPEGALSPPPSEPLPEEHVPEEEKPSDLEEPVLLE